MEMKEKQLAPDCSCVEKLDLDTNHHLELDIDTLLLLLRKVRCASEVKDIVAYRRVCCDDFKYGSLHFFFF